MPKTTTKATTKATSLYTIFIFFIILLLSPTLTYSTPMSSQSYNVTSSVISSTGGIKESPNFKLTDTNSVPADGQVDITFRVL